MDRLKNTFQRNQETVHREPDESEVFRKIPVEEILKTTSSLDLALAFQNIAFYFKQRVSIPNQIADLGNSYFRHGLAELVHNQDWLGLGVLTEQTSLSLAEEKLVQTQLELEVGNLNFQPLLGLYRQFLARGQGFQGISEALNNDITIGTLLEMFADGDDYNQKFSEYFSKIEKPDQEKILGLCYELVKTFRQTKVGSYKKKLPPLYEQQHDRWLAINVLGLHFKDDLSPLKARLTEQFEEQITQFKPDYLQGIQALAIVNPDRLLELSEESAFPEPLQQTFLDNVFLHAPELVLHANQDGRLETQEFSNRAGLLVKTKPELVLTHLEKFADSPQTKDELVLEALLHGNLLEIFQALEASKQTLSLEGQANELAQQIVGQRLEAEYLKQTTPQDKMNFIHAYQGLPFLSQESLLGKIRDRFYQEIANFLAPKILELKAEFMVTEDYAKEEDMSGWGFAQYLYNQLGSNFQGYRGRPVKQLGEYQFFKNLPGKQQKFLITLSVLQQHPTELMQEVVWSLTQQTPPDRYYPMYQTKLGAEAVLKNIPPGNSYYALAIVGYYLENFASLDSAHQVMVKDWISQSIIITDDEETRKVPLKPYQDERDINGFFEVICRVQDPQLTEQFVNFVIKHSDFSLQLASFLQYNDAQLIDLFKTTFSSSQQLRLILEVKDSYAAFQFFSFFTFPNQESKKQVFEQLQKNGNEILQAYPSYGEFVAVLQLFPKSYLTQKPKEVRSLLDLRSGMGPSRWEKLAKFLKGNPELLVKLTAQTAKPLEKVLNSGNQALTELAKMYPEVFFHQQLTEADVAFLDQTITQLPTNVGRMTADMAQFNITVPKDLFLPAKPTPENKDNSKQKKKKPEFDERKKRQLINEYALLKWQSQKTGMTIAQISEVYNLIFSTNKQVELLTLFREGFWGKNLQALYRYKEPFFAALEEQQIVGTADLTEILDSSNLEASIQNVITHASALSSTDPEWVRLSTVALSLVMKKEFTKYGEGVFLNGTWNPAIPDNIAQLRVAMETQLKRMFSLSLEAKERATEQNVELATRIQEEGRDFILPDDTNVHNSRGSHLHSILLTGNLAGECLGKINGRTDGFPGYVDLQVISPAWNGPVTVGNLGSHAKLYSSGESNNVLVYLPDRFKNLITDPEYLSGIIGHRLVPGGVPADQLSLVLCGEIDENEIEQAKVGSVISGVYIPLVSAKTSELLFTPQEYQQRSSELKRFQDLAQMITSSELYSVELQATPNTNPTYTLAEHMQEVTRLSAQLAQVAGCEPEIKEVVLAAASLHDLNKLSGQIQELANVTAASEILDQVKDLTAEQKRQILLLIRHDELLGEILKGTSINQSGEMVLSSYAKKKLSQLERNFQNPELRTALLVLYQADVLGIGGDEYERWQVAAKLEKLGLPVFAAK